MQSGIFYQPMATRVMGGCHALLHANNVISPMFSRPFKTGNWLQLICTCILGHFSIFEFIFGGIKPLISGLLFDKGLLDIHQDIHQVIGPAAF